MKMNRIGNFLLSAASVTVLATIGMLMNTGRVASAPAPSGTVVVVDQTLSTVTVQDSASTTIDVSAYKQIRILALKTLGLSTCEIRVQNLDATTSAALGLLDSTPFGGSNCQLDNTYDTPGGVIKVRVEQDSINGANSYRVVILGRTS